MGKRLVFIFLIGISLIVLVNASPFGYDSNQGSTDITELNITDLDDIADVDVPSPANDEILTFNSTSTNWESQSSQSVSDTNETTRFNRLTDNDCSAGDLVIGVQANGTVLCSADANDGATNIFDQGLNTTENVTFNQLNVTTDVGTDLIPFLDSLFDLGSDAIRWALGFFDTIVTTTLNTTNINTVGINATDWLNISITESQISDLAHNGTTDTNETTRFIALVVTDCAVGTLVIGVQANGTVTCATDDSGSDATWLTNWTDYNLTWTSTENSTYETYNTSGFIIDWNASAFIIDWNSTGFIKDWDVDIVNANSTMKDYVDLNFVNLSGDTMTGILNMSVNNITTINCIVFENGGQICQT